MFHWRISIQKHIFFIKSISKSLYFLKWCPIFDTSPLTQFSKFNNFLWVCWFLGKNLSNFVPPVWKLHNPYCHRVHLKAYLFMTDFWWCHDCTVLGVFLLRQYLNLISKNISCSVPSSNKRTDQSQFLFKVCLFFYNYNKYFLFMNYVVHL